MPEVSSTEVRARAARRESRSRGSCRAPFSTTYIEHGLYKAGARMTATCPKPRSTPARWRRGRPSRRRRCSSWARASSARRWPRAWCAPASRSSACTAARSSCRTRRARSRAWWPATGDIPDIMSRVRRRHHLGARRARARGRGAAGEREAAAARADRAAHVGRQPGAHDPGAGAARTCARSGRCTRWCRSPIARVAVEALKRGRLRHRGRRAGARDRQADRARAGRAGGVPGGREPAALSRGRGDGVELRRGAGRHGADAAGARRACRRSRRCRR